ncbi:MAG: hypothetical protein ACLFPL_03510 [Candidatus Nanoarchaeia archaeon]
MIQYNNNKYKQAQLFSMRFLVILILAIIIWLLSASMISSNQEAIVSSAQDIACRGFLQTYDALRGDALNAAAKVTESRNLFSELGRFCKTDKLTFTSTDKEYVQERFAQASRRCYERYGSGELDFLDFTQREGSYCFICAEVEFEDNDQQEAYQYREIGEWMSENTDPEDNEDDLSYRDLSNIFYITADEELTEQDFPRIEDLQFEDEVIENFGSELGEINQFIKYVRDTYTREITTTEKSYVVLRYNAEGLSYNQILIGAGATAAGTAATGYAVKKGACFLSGIALSFTGFGTIAGIGKTAACLKSTIQDGAKLVRGAIKISKFLSSMPAIKIGGTVALGSLGGSSILGEDVNIDPEDPQSFIDAIQNRELIISNRVKNQLSDENRELLESIEKGEVRIQSNTAQPGRGASQDAVTEDDIQSLILELVDLEVKELQQRGELPDFKQYSEILPESEFYRQCGVVPDARLN